MDAEDHARAHAIFGDALDLPKEERPAFLERACGGDALLRKTVEELLARATTEADPDSERWPGGVLRAALADAEKRSLPLLSRIGDYEITRRIGEGGMGVVFEATQANPHRRVAIKVLRPGLIGPATLARFQREVELLGRLNHPGIATILEAGEERPWGDEGPTSPYLVLEYVDGKRITDHVRRHDLDIAGRLELMARVADAVEHAHQKGIVHRDLKPDNVLVDTEGTPRVLDFGVARHVKADVTRLTQTSHLVGTLSYMSPEQMSGKPDAVGPPADVYALGVMTHELLTGRLPHLLDGMSLPEAIRTVQDQEPPRLRTLNPDLSGDIEAIVGKALEKEPERRYSTAAAFAADLRRVVAHEPVLARRPSAVYRLSRFVRRHRALSLLTGALFVVLLAGVVVSTGMALRESRAREAADSARDEAQRATHRAFLAAAISDLQGGNPFALQAHLAAVPEGARGWAWDSVEARSDDALARLSVGWGGGSLHVREDGDLLVIRPDRLVVVRPTEAGLEQLAEAEGEQWRVSPGGRTALWTDGEQRWWLGDTRDLARDAVLLGKSATAHFAGEDRIVMERGGQLLLLDLACRELSTVPLPAGESDATLRVSQDGSRIAISRGDATWGLSVPFDGGALALSRDGHWRVAFTDEGGTLIAIDQSGELHCIETQRWTPCGWGPLQLDVLSDTSPALSLEADRIVIADWSGRLHLHELSTGKAVANLPQHSTDSVRFSPDGRWMAPIDASGALRLLATKDGHAAEVRLGHQYGLADVAWLSAGRVASLDHFGHLCLHEDSRHARRLRGHRAFVYGVHVAQDSRTIASAAWDGTVRTWDAWTDRPALVLRGGGTLHRSVLFSADGHSIVVAGEGLSEWDTRTGELTRSAPSARLDDIAIVGDALVGVTHAKRIQEWSGDWSTPRYHSSPSEPREGPRLVSAGDGKHYVASDGTMTWMQDPVGSAVVWSTPSPLGKCDAIAMRPGGRRVAVAGPGAIVILRDAQDGRALDRLELEGEGVYALAMHPTEDFLAIGGWNGSVRLWDLERDELIARFNEHERYVRALCFAPDGSFLVSASGDGTLFVHDTQSRAERHVASLLAATSARD